VGGLSKRKAFFLGFLSKDRGGMNLSRMGKEGKVFQRKKGGGGTAAVEAKSSNERERGEL